MCESDVPLADDEEDILDDAGPEPLPANGYGFRGPIDMDVRIKAEGMRLDHYLALNLSKIIRGRFCAARSTRAA